MKLRRGLLGVWGCLLCLGIPLACDEQPAPVPSLSDVAVRFVGRPYAAGPLEQADGVERLTADTSAFDCVTLVETALALRRWEQLPGEERSSERFRAFLQDIRYRGGVLTDYTSRLHYTSDWIADNIGKGWVEDVTVSLAAKAEERFGLQDVAAVLALDVHLMSRFPGRYPVLRQHPEYTVVMKCIEDGINERSMMYIPRIKLVAVTPFLEDGTIVAFTTGRDGLDFAHLGLVRLVDGVPYLLHASSSARQVTVSERPLSDYLAGVSHFSGAVFLRAL